jgi:glycosyltransferase involved in cell wall biosynthesis
MRVSLITTVRDETSSVEALTSAIAAQTRQPDEWIVVDGGSRDDTAERLRSAASARALPLRLEVVPGNIACGRNAAIGAATGSVVAVTDAGCVPEQRWLEALVASLEDGTCDIVAGSTRARVRSAFDLAQWTLLDQLFGAHDTWRAPTLSSRSLAFRRELASQCAYPEWLDHGEDRWLLEEWQRRGHVVRVVEARDAAVVWELRPTLGAFLLQHFRYMRGDARGRLRQGRHALRFAFYAALGLIVAGGQPLLAGALWGVYGAVSAAARWPAAARGMGGSARLGSLLWLAPLLLAMDVAKMAGYLTGRLERGVRRA